MTRFAALACTRRMTTDPRVAADAMISDMARRTGGRPSHVAEEGCWLIHAAPPGQRTAVHRLGPLTLCGDLGLSDLSDLRQRAAAGPDEDPARCILTLWMQRGEAALQHLNGVFAFALHDARSGALWVVRDRMGVRPVAYALANGRCVVASDIPTVLAGLGTAPGIDRQWVADFLSGQLTSNESTAHGTVLRLPPGHLLRIDAEGRATRRAWYRLEDTVNPAPGDAAEALHHALRHATRQACAAEPTATLLSGGLDSSSLALLSVEQGAMRPALSLRYVDPALDEGRFIDDVLARANGGLRPVALDGDADQEALFDIDALLEEQGQPVFAPGLAGSRRLYRCAHGLGMTGVLDGHGGDEVIGGTVADIARLAGEGAWPLALRLAVSFARFTGQSPREAVAQLLAWKGRRGFARLGRALAREAQADPLAWRALVDPSLVRESDLVARVRARQGATVAPSDLPPSVQAHVEVVTQPLIPTAFEVLDRCARAAGVTPHYPFYDHRVVELCIWQPDRAKIARGRPRSLLREAMKGVLPESVRLRRDKVDFMPSFWGGLRRDAGARLADFRRGPGVLEGWADPATLSRDARFVAESRQPCPHTAFRLWRAIWLAAWLERPFVPA